MIDANFTKLIVSKAESLINGAAKSLIFEVPEKEQQRFGWVAGQHITVRVIIDGKAHRRAYSVSASPQTNEPLRITVKKKAGGLVSTYINEQINAGDTLEVMPPFGQFTLQPDASQRRTHYFFGAGSGITPLFAMLCSVLRAEPHSSCHLVYGNHNEKSTLFLNELNELVEQYPNRLTVSHVFSKPSWWSDVSCWKKGQINDAVGECIHQRPTTLCAGHTVLHLWTRQDECSGHTPLCSIWMCLPDAYILKVLVGQQTPKVMWQAGMLAWWCIETSKPISSGSRPDKRFLRR